LINQQILKDGGVEPSAVNSLMFAWKSYQSAKGQPLNKVPHIVCTGIYNVGKSTLLNVLLDTEQFPTGDIPTTKKMAQVEYGGAVYVDTPGLNATEADDQETANAYREADVYLFVANAQNGGVGAQESEWLRELKERHADKTALEQKLVYVLSQCDQLEPETVEKVRTRTSSDLQLVLGMCPDKIFCVDAHTYRDGKAQSETLLVESSGIPALRNFLQGKSRKAAENLANNHAQEIHLRQKAVTEQLNQLYMPLSQQLEKESTTRIKIIEDVNHMWLSFEEELKKATPSTEEIQPFSVPYISLHYQYETGENKSFEKAWRAMKSMLAPYRDAQMDVLYDAIEPIMRTIRQRYSSTGLDSIYFICCDRINQIVHQWILKFQKKGISISGIDDIKVQIDIPYDFDDEMHDQLIRRVIFYRSLEDVPTRNDMSSYYTTVRVFSVTTKFRYGLISARGV